MIELESECTVDCGLDNRRIVVKFPEEATKCSLFMFFLPYILV